MNENSLDRSPTENLLDLHLDKDTWIYTYGSAQLQQVRSFGYECDDRYLIERLKDLDDLIQNSEIIVGEFDRVLHRGSDHFEIGLTDRSD